MEIVLSKYDWLDKFSLFVFDLDDTLYHEKDYLYSGYRKIADSLAMIFGESMANNYYEYLLDEFEHNGRHNLFNRFLDHYNLPVHVDTLLNILHNQHAFIQLDKQAKEMLDLLMEKKKKVYILTNGNVCQQKNKVKLLRMEEFYPDIKVIYASQFEPKPSPVSLYFIMKQEGIDENKTILIGDSQVDEETARNANINYLNIQNVLK